ncbi:hypothetical protein M0638_20485 [Roseomonas sp. NAR14]|uniref:Uncharacterized protein n=1 Tax=Roseomonas acroporae TaxID=2937791 RepID=A0A9X1YAX6_9PROT|nr:hypothetical protein [Roseomonas acroporae]MCK8786753.1 hypothetical protein [Roseomonas acroporae]
MRERELALAVIRQAISDATTKRVVGAARRGGSAASVTAAERQEARAFLTDRTGPWAIARRLWCDAAGVTPAWLERHVARSLV